MVREVASIRKHAKGWRAEVARKGIRKSKVLATRQEAKDWAARQEHLILNAGSVAKKTILKDVLDRYAREVSPTKGGHRWEVVRLEKLARDPLARIQIGDLTATDFAAWRDRRLQEVAPGSVRREMVLLSAVMTQARKEWRLIEVSPLADVRKPPQPQARSRRPTAQELDRIGHVAGADPDKATARAFLAFMFAVETGMRAGEILGLGPGDVKGPVAHLPKTKNGHARDVPLSREALRILSMLPPADPLFGLSSRQLDILWRKSRDRAGVTDLHFHDSRREAVTRLSKKLDVLSLAKMIGHRNISELLTYYDESAEGVAARLD